MSLLIVLEFQYWLAVVDRYRIRIIMVVKKTHREER